MSRSAPVLAVALAAALLASIPAALAQSVETKEWTVYIHLNADNNLGSFGSADLAEMKAASAAAGAHIVVAYDNEQQGDSKLVSLVGSQETMLESGVEYDMGDWRLMAAMADRVFRDFPSRHRMVIMWNHGSGWRSILGQPPVERGISYDDTSGNHITTQQMASAMAEIARDRRVDVLAYDACLMQMVETGYELHESVDLIAASEETEPGDGYQYTSLVKVLAKAPSPVDLGKRLADAYIAQYPRGATYSLVDAAALPPLVRELDALSVIAAGSKELGAAVRASQGYAYAENKDLGMFLKALPARMSAPALEAYRSAVLYSVNTKPATGLAIYLTSSPSSAYSDLRFARDTRWEQMLRTIR